MVNVVMNESRSPTRGHVCSGNSKEAAATNFVQGLLRVIGGPGEQDSRLLLLSRREQNMMLLLISDPGML